MPANLECVILDYNNPDQGRDLLHLLNTYARDPMGGGQGLSDYARSTLLPALAQRPDAVSIVGYLDGQPVGLTNCFETFSTFKAKPVMNIHDFVIVDGHRNQGLAQQLLRAVETMARQRGCCKLTLELLEGNKPAMQAYLKFGFEGYELDPKMGKAFFWEKPL